MPVTVNFNEIWFVNSLILNFDLVFNKKKYHLTIKTLKGALFKQN